MSIVDRAVQRLAPGLGALGRAALWLWGPTTVVLVAALMASQILAVHLRRGGRPSRSSGTPVEQEPDRSSTAR